jgi:hypothetical protein
MAYIMDFESFLTEAIVTVKRKYTDSHPAQTASNYAPIRERILAFVKEKKTVTKAQIYEFIRGLNEGSHRTASVNWVRRNEQYFNVVEKHGTTYYSLSKLGERVHHKINNL